MWNKPFWAHTTISVVPISHYHGDQYQDKFVRKGQERCSRKLGVEEVSRDGSKYLTQIYVELTIDKRPRETEEVM